jgi:hypothetical protein
VLSGLQRHRPSSSEAPPPVTPLSAGASSPWTPRSGSETERPPPTQSRFSLGLGRRTLGSKSNLSLDAPSPQPAQAPAATTARGGVQTLARASTTRERRRTITEIFS